MSRGLGKLEKNILRQLNLFEGTRGFAYAKYHRPECFHGKVALLGVRTRIYGSSVTPSEKASFSRTLRRLEEKGLIETANHATRASYRTHAILTEKGGEHLKVNYSVQVSKVNVNPEEASP